MKLKTVLTFIQVFKTPRMNNRNQLFMTKTNQTSKSKSKFYLFVANKTISCIENIIQKFSKLFYLPKGLCNAKRFITPTLVYYMSKLVFVTLKT